VSAPTYLPNLLSSLRIVLAPALFGAAYSNSRIGFAIVLGFALATDAFDGYFARRSHAESELGKRLDRWGDGLTTSMAAVGVALIWPQIVSREWPWVTVALVGYLAIGLQRLLEAPRVVTYPTWWAKLFGLVVPLTLVPLLAGWEAWPFHVAAVLQALAGLAKLMAVRSRSEPSVNTLPRWPGLRPWRGIKN